MISLFLLLFFFLSPSFNDVHVNMVTLGKKGSLQQFFDLIFLVISWKQWFFFQHHKVQTRIKHFLMSLRLFHRLQCVLSYVLILRKTTYNHIEYPFFLSSLRCLPYELWFIRLHLSRNNLFPEKYVITRRKIPFGKTWLTFCLPCLFSFYIISFQENKSCFILSFPSLSSMKMKLSPQRIFWSELIMRYHNFACTIWMKNLYFSLVRSQLTICRDMLFFFFICSRFLILLLVSRGCRYFTPPIDFAPSGFLKSYNLSCTLHMQSHLSLVESQRLMIRDWKRFRISSASCKWKIILIKSEIKMNVACGDKKKCQTFGELRTKRCHRVCCPKSQIKKINSRISDEMQSCCDQTHS